MAHKLWALCDRLDSEDIHLQWANIVRKFEAWNWFDIGPK